MAVTINDVRKIAGLARLQLDDHRLTDLTSELNGILGHMEVLNRVDTTGVEPTAGGATAGSGLDIGMRRRDDVVAPVPMRTAGSAMAAESRDGFILVPRLSTHEEL